MLSIIQARMGSERLPGKSLRLISGKPLLAWVVDRLSVAPSVRRVVVATSTLHEDDPIAQFCEERNIACVRGSHEDVAQRFRDVLKEYTGEAFVRITGDSPLCDPEVIEFAIQQFMQGDFDLVTNTLKRSFPKGISVEVIRTESFRKVQPAFVDPDEKEHVTLHFYRNPKRYRIFNFSADRDASKINLSVDTQEDFERVEFILNTLKANETGGFTWKDALREYEKAYV